jgi:hypothetical protein
MFQRERAEAAARLDTAIRFRQKGGGYWYPDTNIDRCAIELAGVKTFKPAKTPDEMLTQLSGVAFCEFLTPPLLRRQEAFATRKAFQERKAALDALRSDRPLSDNEQERAALIDAQLDELEFSSAEVLDMAAEVLNTL